MDTIQKYVRFPATDMAGIIGFVLAVGLVMFALKKAGVTSKLHLA